MKIKFKFGDVLFAYTQNIMWWGTIENVSMRIDNRVFSFTDYLKIIRKLT